MPAGIIGRRPRSGTRRNRRLSGQKLPAFSARPIGVAEFEFAPPHVTLTFNQTVVLDGIPQYPSNLNTLPTAAVLTSPNVLQLTYPAGAITRVTVPFQEPAVRNLAGGYVSPVQLDTGE